MKKLELLYNLFLSERIKKKSEKIIVFISIFSFLAHLILIILNKLTIIDLSNFSNLFNNPIAAIYTPFSFILVYEVYLLVYYLPKSTSIYIGKQYEIISLIIIRRIFKDMSNLQFTDNWFNVKSDVIFMYDLVAIIILFFLIYKFYNLNDQNNIYQKKEIKLSTEVEKFIRTKKYIATLLVPILLILSFYSLGKWTYESFFSITKLVYDFKDVNKIFFDDFFTILILVDVFLLLFSFLHSDKFSKVIRNSGFIISTIMIKLSFGTEGILNIVLIVMSVVFGIIILAIHNKYEKLENNR
jgi:uncharacterized membrane protein (DUF373 family)